MFTLKMTLINPPRARNLWINPQPDDWFRMAAFLRHFESTTTFKHAQCSDYFSLLPLANLFVDSQMLDQAGCVVKKKMQTLQESGDEKD